MKLTMALMAEFVVLSAIGVYACLCHNVRDFFGISMFMGAGWFVWAKFQICFYIARGDSLLELIELERRHQLRGIRFWSLRIFKMPLVYVILLSLPTVVLTFLLYYAFFEQNGFGDQTTMNIRAITEIATCALVIALLHWRIYWREYFFVSEYEARLEFKAKGYSNEVIEEKVRDLTNAGAFGPPEP